MPQGFHAISDDGTTAEYGYPSTSRRGLFHTVTVNRPGYGKPGPYEVSCSCEDSQCRRKRYSMLNGKGSHCKHAEEVIGLIDAWRLSLVEGVA